MIKKAKQLKILLLSFKIDRGVALATALNKLGYEVDVEQMGKKNYSILKNLRRTFSSLRRLGGKHDVVITEGLDYNGILSMMLSVFYGTPYILYVKGFYPDDAKDTTNIIFRFFDKLLNERLFTKAHTIVCLSFFLKRQYLQYFDDKEKLKKKIIESSVIYHSVDEIFLEDNVRKSPVGVHLLYVGNLDFTGKATGAELLLDTMNDPKLANTVLNIIGSGKHLPRLQESASHLGLKNVVFHGYLEKDRLLEMYKEASVFVYPSFQDSLSTVTMEAQAVGVPVVVTNTSGAQELVKNGVTGFICEPDKTTIADHIRAIIDDPVLMGQMSSNAKRHIRENLTWDVTAKKFDSVVRKTIAKEVEKVE